MNYGKHNRTLQHRGLLILIFNKKTYKVVKYNKERFLELVSERDPKTIKRVKWRIRNRWWLRIVQQIHLHLLILRDRILNK